MQSSLPLAVTNFWEFLLFRMPSRYNLSCSVTVFLIFCSTDFFILLNDLFIVGAINSLSFSVVVIDFLLHIHLAGWWHLAIFILHSDTPICPLTFSYSLSNLKCIELSFTVHHMPERVDDNLVKLSVVADIVRVSGEVDKHNFPVNALHINSCHIWFFSPILSVVSVWHQSSCSI